MTREALISFAVVIVVACIAGGIDVWKFKVPNVLTFPLAFSGILFHTLISGTTGLASSLVGVLFALVVLSLFFLIGAIGAGDVKLLCGVGAWLGMPATGHVLLASTLVGGAYSAILLAWYGGFNRVGNTFYVMVLQCVAMGKHLGAQEGVQHVAATTGRRRRLVPFAAMIALGVILVAAFGAR